MTPKPLGTALEHDRRDALRAENDRLAKLQSGTLGRGDYRTYINSGEWRQNRQRATKFDKGECWVCRATGVRLDAHHRSYRRLGQERQEDLVMLCRPCHDGVHELARCSPHLTLWGATKVYRRRVRRNLKRIALGLDPLPMPEVRKVGRA